MPTFNATDSNFSRSEAWITQGTSLASNRVGSYIVGRFTGTSLTASVNADNTRVVSFQIDDAPFGLQTLSSGVNTISLGIGLAAGNHKFGLYYDFRGTNAGNRFDGPDVTVNSFTCDALIAETRSSNRLYLFGDSIYTSYLASTHVDSVSMALREGLRPLWHVSSFAIGGTGWQNTGGGSMPPIGTHWNTAWTGQDYTSRPSPDAVYVCMGTNDGGHTDAIVQTNAQNTLTAMLTAWPSAKILLQTPWGGIKRTQVIAAHTAINNPRLILIDNGTEYNRGITTGANDYYSPDDVHPNLKALLGIVTRMGLDLGLNTGVGGSGGTNSGALTATGTFTYV
jgi:lysophospholipase L1-like esterase